MKNTKFWTALQLFFTLGGLALLIAGIVIGIASFFTPHFLLFNGIVLAALGTIIVVLVNMYFMFVEGLEAYAKGLELLVNTLDNVPMPSQNFTPEVMGTRAITITPDTPQEEIERLKREFPPLTDMLNSITKDRINMGGHHGFGQSDYTDYEEIIEPSDITKLPIEQLEILKTKAVESNDFENAAKIRDEISKRKTTNN